jgi:hypothetical protein
MFVITFAIHSPHFWGKNIADTAVDGGTAAHTQQPADKSIQEEIDRVCVASGGGKGCKHATTSRKRGVDVDSQPCCLFVIYITIKLNES